jgi:hypothetical protein
MIENALHQLDKAYSTYSGNSTVELESLFRSLVHFEDGYSLRDQLELELAINERLLDFAVCKKLSLVICRNYYSKCLDLSFDDPNYHFLIAARFLRFLTSSGQTEEFNAICNSIIVELEETIELSNENKQLLNDLIRNT